MIEIKRPLEVGELRILKNHYKKNTIQELFSELDTAGDIDFMLDLIARMLHLIKSRDGVYTMSDAEEEIIPPNTPNTCLLYTSPSPRDS